MEPQEASQEASQEGPEVIALGSMVVVNCSNGIHMSITNDFVNMITPTQEQFRFKTDLTTIRSGNCSISIKDGKLLIKSASSFESVMVFNEGNS